MAFALYDGKFDVSGTSWLLSQNRSMSVQANVEVFKGFYSGGVTPQFVSVLQAEPRVQIQTGDLSTLLTKISLTAGYYMTGSSIVLPFQERAVGGTFASTSNTLSMTRAFGHIASIEAQQGQAAVASLELIPLWDGSTLPIVISTGVTLDAQAFNNEYSLGPAKIGSAALPGLISVTVNPGFRVNLTKHQGNAYTREAFIQIVEPSITWTIEGTGMQSTLTNLFKAISSTAIQYLRKRTAGGTYVADATSEHIALTLTGGMTVTDTTEASGQENGTISITAHGKTLAVSQTSAIVEGS